MCWGQSHSDSDKTAALQVIDAGLKRYPESALLMGNKGALLETFGDLDGAKRLYDEAYRKSKAHLRTHPESRKDQYVLERIGRRLGGQELATPVVTLLPVDTKGLLDARPPWQQETSRRMAANDCQGALQYLDDNHVAPPDAEWYTLYSQADLLCWQNGLGEKYKVDGLSVLERGLTLLPKSPRLRKSKGDYYRLIRDEVSAKALYASAAQQANMVLSAHPSGREAQEAEDVLNELRLEGFSTVGQ
jgi:tetratricopeptide (TPR) repeat protein